MPTLALTRQRRPQQNKLQTSYIKECCAKNAAFFAFFQTPMLQGMRRVTLIINPNSGTLSKKGIEKWLPGKLERMGFQVDVRHTDGPGDAKEIAAHCASRGDYGVLACGGDGTVNEVASGLIGTDTALGIVPMGSGNGFARHLGIPVDTDLSIRVIAQDNIQACDYGTVNGRPFFCTFGIGFDAAVSERFSRKHRRGLNAYLVSAIDEFVKYRSAKYEIIVGDEVITDRAFLVAVCNASQYGNNAFIAPAALTDDGLLDVIVVHDGNFIEKAWMGVEMLTGSIGNHGKIRAFRTNSLKIRSSEAESAHLDGEPIHFPGEVDIKCVPGKIKVFAPRQEIRFIPILTPIWYTLREWGVVISRPFRKH